MTIPIHDASDPRLDYYRGLRDRRLADARGRFIAEGKRLTERLIASTLTVESILVDDRRADEIIAIAPPEVPVYKASREVMAQLAGFAIHTGVLSVGMRPRNPTIDELVDDASGPITLMIAPMLKEPANVGAMVRTCAAFGVTGLIIGPQCCDPFYRRAVRVSMGTVFRLPIRRSEDLAADLHALRECHRVQCLATTLNDAELLHDMQRPRNDRLALLLGHEVEGLEPELEALCDRRVTLPMHLGTDSLNVSVAAAVFCYHFIRPTKPIRLAEAEEE
jgi:tRNA G18 (ribose-2'-O)-methylase SpoU